MFNNLTLIGVLLKKNPYKSYFIKTEIIQYLKKPPIVNL